MSTTSELVDELEHIASSEGYYDDKFPSKRSITIKRAADIIKELSEKLHNLQMERSSQYYNGGWIPVKWHKITEDERKKEGYPGDWVTYLDCLLPNDGDEILITVCGSDGSIHVEKDTCCVADGFYLDSGYDWLYDVIAWMPLPDPYKESEVGND
mgnify:CR=1 FL=1